MTSLLSVDIQREPCAVCAASWGGTGPITAAQLLDAELHPSSDRCSVYVALDGSGTVLYVGITGSGMNRFDQHAAESHWWREMDRMVVRHFNCRHDARDVEAFLIGSFEPEWNVAHPVRDVERGRRLAMGADFERDIEG